MSTLDPSEDPDITRTTADMSRVNRWYRDRFGRPTRDHSQERSAWAIREDERKAQRQPNLKHLKP